jgi:hypothetical protein
MPAVNPLLPLERSESFDLLARDRVTWSGQPLAMWWRSPGRWRLQRRIGLVSRSTRSPL